MTVTRRELTLRIAGKLGMPPQDVARIVEALFETLANRLVEGERWEFRGFGVFEVRERAARIGRNPRTGETVPVPPRRAVVFQPGKFMKQEVARWDAAVAGQQAVPNNQSQQNGENRATETSAEASPETNREQETP